MARALITGAGGFVGPYLARQLASLGREVWGGSPGGRGSTDYRGVALNVRDAGSVQRVMQSVAPDEVYHLAGITRPALDAVHDFYDVNLRGALNVLEAAREVPARVLLVSTAYVYGRHEQAIDELTPLEPVNHYGASKAAADLAAIGYALGGLAVVRVRPFNHSGPGQSPDFVLPSLVRQVARVEAGLEPPVLQVGNLDSVRDFSDVRDIVRAYPVLLERGENGAVYNLASGVGVSVRELLDRLCSQARARVRVEMEPARVRPTDIARLVGNPARARSLGWVPEVSLDETIADMLTFERERATGL